MIWSLSGVKRELPTISNRSFVNPFRTSYALDEKILGSLSVLWAQQVLGTFPYPVIPFDFSGRSFLIEACHLSSYILIRIVLLLFELSPPREAPIKYFLLAVAWFAVSASNSVMARGGTNAHEMASTRHHDDVPLSSMRFVDCDRERYRDFRTERCVGTADVAR